MRINFVHVLRHRLKNILFHICIFLLHAWINNTKKCMLNTISAKRTNTSGVHRLYDQVYATFSFTSEYEIVH